MQGFEEWTLDDVRKHNARIKNMTSKNKFNIKDDKLLVENKKSKYGANKVEVDGIKFDSQRESERYIELKQLERVGIIKDLQLQVVFELQPKFVLDRTNKSSN